MAFLKDIPPEFLLMFSTRDIERLAVSGALNDEKESKFTNKEHEKYTKLTEETFETLSNDECLSRYRLVI